MPACYQLADPEVHAMAREVIEKHHNPRLYFAGGEPVRLCLMFVFGDTSDEAPLKSNGYPCSAKVSVINLKQRVDKRADAEILIDQRAWEGMSEPERVALLDHMITHLEFKIGDDGIVSTDDIGRPNLRLRLCDWRLEGFREVAHRHGEHAPEVIAAREFEKNYGAEVLAADRLFA